MNYLNIKLKRDVLKNWTQFFSVFLMSFLSILVFVGLQGAWGGLDKSLDKFITTANLADVWVYSTGFSDSDLDKFRELGTVSKVAGKTQIKVSNLRENGDTHYLSLETHSKNNLSQPYITEGDEFLETNEKGIWLNQEYASANQINIGENIMLQSANQEVELLVKGFIQSPEKIYYTGSQEFIAPNYAVYGYGIISETTLKNNFNFLGSPNLLEIQTSESDLRTESAAILGAKQLAYYNRQTLNDVANALDRVGQIRNLSYMFSFIFILLAILAMYTTIRRLIESQLKEIAVLKALGCSNRQIGTHYASYGLLIGGVGVIAGAAAAPILSWFVLSTQKDMFSLPEWLISYNYLSAILCVIVILVCTLSAFFASREARIGLPALFLRGESMKQAAPVFIEKIPFIWKRINYASRWAFRDATINRVRLLMGIIGVAGGMMLLTAGFGMPESIHHLVDKAYSEDFTYDKRLATSDFKGLTEEYTGQGVQILPARFEPDDGYNRLLIVINEGDFVKLKTADKQAVKNGGIYLTDGFAKRAKLTKGDRVSVYPGLDSQKYEFEIKGIITSETNQGAYVMQETWEAAGGHFRPQTLLTGKVPSLEEVKKNPKIDSVIQMTEQKANAYEFVDSLMSIFLMIIGFAVLLVVVVLYNLGTLNFVERTRDYATLRVIGFHKSELRKITMIENILTTLIGWLVGIPLGLWFLDQYVKTFSTIQLEYTSYISWLNLGLASLVVWTCSLTTTLFIGRRIQKLNMVEALKGVD